MNKFLALLGLLIVTYVAVGLIMPSDEELRAYNVVTECFQEKMEACKSNDDRDACESDVSKSCAAQHPKMYKIFNKRIAECSRRYPGTAIDNPDIWECAGAEFK